MTFSNRTLNKTQRNVFYILFANKTQITNYTQKKMRKSDFFFCFLVLPNHFRIIMLNYFQITNFWSRRTKLEVFIYYYASIWTKLIIRSTFYHTFTRLITQKSLKRRAIKLLFRSIQNFKIWASSLSFFLLSSDSITHNLDQIIDPILVMSEKRKYHQNIFWQIYF